MNDCVRHALPTFFNFQHRNVKKKVIDRNLKKKNNNNVRDKTKTDR